MNILFFALNPIVDTGGVGRVTRTLADGFAAQGHRSVFVGLDPQGRSVQADTRQRWLPSKRVACADNVAFLRELIDEQGIDVIVNQAGWSPHVLDLLDDVDADVPFVSVHHNCVACLQDAYEGIVDRSLQRRGVPRALRRPSLLSLLKARNRLRTARCIRRTTSGDRTLVLLFPSFVDELHRFTSQFRTQNVVAIANPAPFEAETAALQTKERRVLFVGRLENGQKRVDRVLEVWDRVRDCAAEWQLDIVGDGSDRASLEREAERRGLRNVTFHGFADPVPFYRRSRALMLTSAFEGYGMVLVEAQAFGCVPVALRCFSAIEEVIDDERSGLLAAAGDVAGLAQQLRRLMEDEALCGALASNALDVAGRFSKEHIADQWLDLLGAAIAERQGRRRHGSSAPRGA